MQEIRFRSLDELYARLLPAISSLVNELKEKKNIYVKSDDIWNFLTKTKWQHETNLELCDMVNDIFNIDEYELLKYVSNN